MIDRDVKIGSSAVLVFFILIPLLIAAVATGDWWTSEITKTNEDQRRAMEASAAQR